MSEQDSAGAVQDQGAPLTQEEKRLVNRLFSEPLEFPQIFRNWLKNFIETSGLQLPKSAINVGVGGGSGSLAGLPAGLILPMGGSTVPSGSLPCNGAAVSREQYDGLFQAIGTAWGTGDGTTTFNVPDLRDRALYGAGSKVGLGQTDGGALGVRGPSHKHGVNIPNSSSGYNSLGGSADGVGDHTHPFTVIQADSYNMLEGQQSLRNIAKQIVSNLGTGGGGAHGHSVSVGGTINVSGTVNGETGGGGTLNTPGYAGVQYVITT